MLLGSEDRLRYVQEGDKSTIFSTNTDGTPIWDKYAGGGNGMGVRNEVVWLNRITGRIILKEPTERGLSSPWLIFKKKEEPAEKQEGGGDGEQPEDGGEEPEEEADNRWWFQRMFR